MVRYVDAFDLMMPAIRGREGRGFLFSPSPTGVARAAALALIDTRHSNFDVAIAAAKATMESLIIRPFDDPHDEVRYE